MPEPPASRQGPVNGTPTPAQPQPAPRQTIPPLAEQLPEPTAKALRPSAPGGLAKPRPARPTFEQQAEAEKHLRQANLLRVRGDFNAALDELAKAATIDASDPAPHSLAAEMLRNVGRPDDAVAAYERAKELSISPGARAAIEAKIAKLVIEQDELNNPEESTGSVGALPLDKGGPSMVVASAIVPGLGQLFAGEPAKAATLFVIWLVSVAAFFLLLSKYGSLYRVGPVSASIVGLVVWIYSIADSVMEMRRTSDAAPRK